MNEKALIVQSNYLIENRPRMTKDETRLFLTIISIIKKDDIAFKPYKIPVQEFADLWGIENDSAYTQIKEALVGLNSKVFVIEGINPETNKMKFFSTSYLSSASYEQGQGYAEVEISEKFKPFLLEIKEQYTKYILKNIVNLRGIHSIRTYELLKQYEALELRSFLITEYKKLLAIEDKYTLNADLKKRVLEPAKEEINSNTDILIDYKINGRGKKAEIEFSIKPKKIIEINDYRKIDKEQIEREKLLKIAEKMVENTGRTAHDYISFIKSIATLDGVNDIYAYLKTCINNTENLDKFLYQGMMDLENKEKREKAKAAAQELERQMLEEKEKEMLELKERGDIPEIVNADIIKEKLKNTKVLKRV